MATPFLVELVSVEAMVWSGEADMVSACTTEGEIGILARHAPLLGQLRDPSRVRILTDGEEIAYDIAGGFLSIANDQVTILAESAQPAEGPDPAGVAALAGTGSTVAEPTH